MPNPDKKEERKCMLPAIHADNCICANRINCPCCGNIMVCSCHNPTTSHYINLHNPNAQPRTK